MKYSEPSYSSHRGKERHSGYWTEDGKKPREDKGKGDSNTRTEKKKNLTITTNCSHYCSHSLHQYCDSYGGVIRACHRHTNYFSNGCYYSSLWQPGSAAIVLNGVNCNSAAVHPDKVKSSPRVWFVTRQNQQRKRASNGRLHTDKESGQIFASGGRPEKLISSRFVHPLLLAAVTPSKEISRSGIAATRKEKWQRKWKSVNHRCEWNGWHPLSPTERCHPETPAGCW